MRREALVLVLRGGSVGGEAVFDGRDPAVGDAAIVVVVVGIGDGCFVVGEEDMGEEGLRAGENEA